MRRLRFEQIILLVLISSLQILAGPQLGLGLGWAPTADIADSLSDGSLYFRETGTFYDVISPEIQFLWDFEAVSLGLSAGTIFSNTKFVQNQPTALRGYSVGGKFIYNYVMHERGEWLFPMMLDSRWHSLKITYKPPVGDFEISGEGWDIYASFGVERIWNQKFSLGLVLGWGLSRATFDGSEFGITPALKADGWRFTIISRFGFPKNRFKN